MIVDFKDLKKLNEENRLFNQKIVLVGGCFDVLHIGHIIFLEKAKGKGDVLIVLLESDESLKELKGKDRPIFTQIDRAMMLSALRTVDFVIMIPKINNSQYDKLVLDIKPNIVATTRGDRGLIHKKRVAKLVNAKVAYVTAFIGDHSTTKLIKKLGIN